MSVAAKDTNPKDVAAAASGRVPLGLLPDTARVAAALALYEGACKYGRYNWRIAGVSASVYHDALHRHIAAWWNGEDIDAASGLSHLAHALACIAILIDADAVGKLTDDRPPRAPVAQMIASFAADVLRIRSDYAHLTPHHCTLADDDSA